MDLGQDKWEQRTEYNGEKNTLSLQHSAQIPPIRGENQGCVTRFSRSWLSSEKATGIPHGQRFVTILRQNKIKKHVTDLPVNSPTHTIHTQDVNPDRVIYLFVFIYLFIY